MQALLGLAAFCVVAWSCSSARAAVSWRAVGVGMALQFVLAGVFLYLPGARAVFDVLNTAVEALQVATAAGTGFVFGYLGGGPPPFDIAHPENGFVFVFRALPLLLVLSALTALLTYWRILPWLIGWLARGLERSLGLGGAVGFGAASNIFLGMVEAPLFVRPYLARMTRSELFVLMTTGMSTIAGTVLVLYASILRPVIPDALGHLLIASIISVPAAVVYALIMVPETAPRDDPAWSPPRGADSAMGAIANGAQSGLTMCLQITALLIVLISLVRLVDLGLQALLPAMDGAPLSLERVLGFVFAPVAWLMGIPWPESARAGQLLGVKTVLNEMLAYLEFARLPPTAFSAKSKLILTYALCGFANIGSLGILIAGMSELAPTRRAELLQLGPRAVLAGTLATLSTGAVIGLVWN